MFCIVASWEADFTPELATLATASLQGCCLRFFFSSVSKVLPDYLKALLSIVPQGKASEQQLQQIARLAALQHRAKDSIYLPTV